MFREQGGGLHGLTTAASIWAAAAIGIVTGLDHLVFGVLGTVLVLVILEVEYLAGLNRWTVRSGSVPAWSAHQAKRDRSSHQEPDAGQSGEGDP